MSPWWMRPTAEGLEEENRNKPKPENPPEPAQVMETPEPAPVTPAASLETAHFEPEPPRERPLYSEEPREWGGEPAPPAPVFLEEEEPPVEAAAAHPLEEPQEEEAEEPYDEEEEELEASEAEREEGEAKEGEDKDADGRRRRRSRGRRGGRRRNGKTAAAPTTATPAPEPAEEEDEEDEAWHEEPAEEPLPAAPRRLTPVPAPSRYVISPSEVESVAREIVISVPDSRRAEQERKIAMFCDLENIALGVRDSEISKFDITLVLERLVEKGKIIVKKAYADWERYSDYKRPFHEAAIELIDIPQKYYSGKNSADIKMVVDAMDLSYSKEHLDTFVLLSGDSDFSPLVSKLKENNKYVIGIGVKNSSSNLLVDNCDEFIYYEDVWRDSQKGPKLDGLNKKTAEAFSLMIESIQALIRENKDVLWGSMIKQTMQRKRPSFNEGYYGYSTFSELLEDAERKQIIKLKKDQRSGTYIVTGFAKTGEGMTATGRR
ncbi:MAG TPA: NYN domain-containing protein [Thermoanaerobaculia bacterium]|nr:NYN domain-containing protein [Thermoanaerobaculia bacterium]